MMRDNLIIKGFLFVLVTLCVFSILFILKILIEFLYLKISLKLMTGKQRKIQKKRNKLYNKYNLEDTCIDLECIFYTVIELLSNNLADIVDGKSKEKIDINSLSNDDVIDVMFILKNPIKNSKLDFLLDLQFKYDENLFNNADNEKELIKIIYDTEFQYNLIISSKDKVNSIELYYNVLYSSFSKYFKDISIANSNLISFIKEMYFVSDLVTDVMRKETYCLYNMHRLLSIFKILTSEKLCFNNLIEYFSIISYNDNNSVLPSDIVDDKIKEFRHKKLN